MRPKRSSFLRGAAWLVAVSALLIVSLPPSVMAQDVDPPEGTISVPVRNEVFTHSPVVVAGAASDDESVAAVRIAIRDRGSLLWWRGDGTWGSFLWLNATLDAPGASSTAWSFSFPGVSGDYTVGAQAVDGSGKWDQTASWVRFVIDDTNPTTTTTTTLPPTTTTSTTSTTTTSTTTTTTLPQGDVSPPDGTVSTPGWNETFTSSPVELSGTATDDVSVAAVRIAIRDRGSLLWWRGDGTWGSFLWLNATLDTPGASSTAWSFSFPGVSGDYTVGAQAVDGTGKWDQTAPWVRFVIDERNPTTTTTTTLPPTTTSSTTTTTPPPPGDQPDLVFIFTDDQRWDTLWAMPSVQSLLIDEGVEFNNGFVVNALCCPSRAATFQGAYSHGTGVYHNNGDNGPLARFDDTSTVATWLDDVGYRTAFMGKYFNGWTTEYASYVPPGWDRWVAFATDDIGGGRFYDYDLSFDGSTSYYGFTPADYSTDVFAAEAVSFIESTPAGEPLMLWFAPYAPHEPATPAPRHTTAYQNLPAHRPPNFDEADVSDKPAYIQSLAPFNDFNRSRVDNIRGLQLRSLLAVDDAVADIVSALEATGRLHNTMIVFSSDNGFSWGEHRWGATGANNKQVPYDESARVPFVVRYDALVASASTSDDLVLTIDVAPTFTELAGTTAPGADGTSLLPLLSGENAGWRTDFLIEHLITQVPTYCAVRTQDHLYTQYATGEEELYVVASDPYQLANRASDPALFDVRNAFRSRTVELCDPPPPGFTPFG